MRVLITGAASGLGAALAEIYAGRGDRVLVTDVHPELPPGPPSSPRVVPPTGGRLRSTPNGHLRTHPRLEQSYLQLDVRDEAHWERARRWVENEWGGLDLLVNNAGVAAGGRIDVLPLEDWEWIISINLMGVVKGCRTFVPMLKGQRSGRIVNVASMAGLVHPPGMSSYNVVKAGVVALSETLVHELAPYDVDVSVVCASFFRTNLHTSLRGSDPVLESTARGLITSARHDAPTIATRVVKALDRGTYLVLPHPEGRIVYAGKRFLSPWYRRAMKRVAARTASSARQHDADGAAATRQSSNDD